MKQAEESVAEGGPRLSNFFAQAPERWMNAQDSASDASNHGERPRGQAPTLLLAPGHSGLRSTCAICSAQLRSPVLSLTEVPQEQMLSIILLSSAYFSLSRMKLHGQQLGLQMRSRTRLTLASGRSCPAARAVLEV